MSLKPFEYEEVTRMEFSPSLTYPLILVVEPSIVRGTDDARLIRWSQSGDVEAFNLLVERYQHRVYTVCFRMLGKADAEDAMQEVFLSAFQGIQRYRGGSFIGWLLRIATNKCLDYLRARARIKTVSLDQSTRVTDEAPPPQIHDRVESPEQRVLRTELAQNLEFKIRELPTEQRLVLILSDIEGYSHKEIITATGWQPGTVKSRLSRARARLRVALQQGDRDGSIASPAPTGDRCR